MMDRWANAHKLHAGGLDMSSARTRMGLVQSYDPVNAAVKVTIQPEGVLTGWLPLGCALAGASAIISPPNPGDQVVLEAQEGDAEHWIVSHRVFSTAQMPPTSPGTGTNVQTGEVAIIHQSGTYVHFANNGTIYSGGGLWLHNGALVATGEIIRGWNTADQVTLGQHTHLQGPDAHGDAEQPTNSPTPGT